MHFQLMCISMPKIPFTLPAKRSTSENSKEKKPSDKPQRQYLSPVLLSPFSLPISISETQNVVKPNLFHFCKILVSHFVDKHPYVETSTVHTTSIPHSLSLSLTLLHLHPCWTFPLCISRKTNARFSHNTK